MNASSKSSRLEALFAPSGFFVVRAPLLSWETFEACSEGCTAKDAASGDLETALAHDRRTVRALLRNVVRDRAVREALFIASPSLDARLPRWLDDADGDDEAEVEAPLYRYFARMSGRCTPFGLFAGCAVGRLGDHTRLALGARSENGRHSRLDNDYLVSLVDALASTPEVRADLRYRPSTSLYRAAGRIHFAEAHGVGRGRMHRLVVVEPTPYLDLVLAEAKGGASLETLANAIVAFDAEITIDEANAYVNELVDRQILASDLVVPMSGIDPTAAACARLVAVPAAKDASDAIGQAARSLAALDAEGVGHDPGQYRSIAEGLSAMPIKPAINRLFQVDMVTKTESLALGPEVLREVMRGVEILHDLSDEGSALEAFRARFAERYEDREVPLCEALDDEIGIGLGGSRSPHTEASPLLAGVLFPPRGGPALVPWSKRQSLLLRHWEKALREGARAIELTKSDVDAFAGGRQAPLPDAFQVVCTLVAKSEEHVSRGDFQVFVQNVMGPSGASMLGRFCHADPALESLVRDHVKAEEAVRPDAVFAEVIHLPFGRVGNIVSRPSLREYEIEYLGASGLPVEKRIALDDLMLSMRGGRLTLRSTRLGREVIPRLTNAHNYQNGLPIYRFLCLLSREQVAAGLALRWGALDAASFVPRVSHGRIVLSLARWNIDGNDLEPLKAKSAIERARATAALRSRLDLPRWVVVVDGDNTLPVDLDNALSVDSFLDLVKTRNGITLTELYPASDDLPLRGPEGAYRHELVIPFVRRAPSPTNVMPATSIQSSPRASAAGTPSVLRKHHPGSEWLYAKLYTGPALADRVLREVVAPLVREVLDEGACDRFFFLRYSDPDWHVRLRFHGDPSRLRSDVLARLEARVRPLMADGSIHRWTLDTYAPEVERYGGPLGVAIAERVFHADSLAALELLALDGFDANARWRLVHLGMHTLLDDLGLNDETRLHVMRQIRDGFAAEHGLQGAFERPLGDKYRRERTSLERSLAFDHDNPVVIAGAEVLARRSQAMVPIVQALRGGVASGEVRLEPAALAGSYLHMFANRMFRASARAQELVLYDFLTRAYDSRVARARASNAKPRATGS